MIITNVNNVLLELEKIQDPMIKKIYINHGVKEPLFGIKISNLTKLTKKIKSIDHNIVMDLFETNNYDAMYFAKMVANPKLFTKKDFEKIIKKAYCREISDYIIASILSKNDLAMEISLKWITNSNQYYQSAGYTCLSLLIKEKCKDINFLENNENIFNELLTKINDNIHNEQNWTKYAMNNLLINIGCFYPKLQIRAIEISKNIGEVKVEFSKKTNCKVPNAYKYISKIINKNSTS